MTDPGITGLDLPAGVDLERARPDDASKLRDLARAAYAHYVERVGREPGPMVDDYDARVTEDECWMVREHGQLLGYLVLRWQPDHVLLDNVAVAPNAQGRGIGNALLSLAERRGRDEGRPEIRLYTHVTMVENIARYSALGYVETHREDASGFSRVFMAKRL